MYYPHCLRCKTLNNLGDKICGSCNITLAVARAVNTALDKFECNNRKTMQYLGINSNSFYDLIGSVPEITEAFDGIKAKQRDELKKIVGRKVSNKANPVQCRLFKGLIRETNYSQMPFEKQEEFAYFTHDFLNTREM